VFKIHIRRLVKSGEASHTVSLPKNWIDDNKLSRGDLIYIQENPNNELVVTSNPQERKREVKEITINVDGKKLDSIQREITSAYINNYNSITIIGKELSTIIKEIRQILHDFVALEISEQTATKIVANDLLNVDELSVEKTIRRMDMIVRSILQDSLAALDGEDLHESIVCRDLDVNRQYFLVYRILKSAMKDKNICKSFGLDTVQAHYYWYLSVNLENLADQSKNISQLLRDTKVKKDEEIRELYSKMEKAYLDVMKSFFNKNVALAETINSFRRSYSEELDEFFKLNNKPEIAQIVGNLREMSTLISNISRIVMDYS